MFGASGPYLDPHSLLFSASLRWVDSSRHFAGSNEQFQREKLGSNVTNRQRVLDLSGQYQTSKQDSLSLSIPILIYGSWGLKLPQPTATTPGGPHYNQVAAGVSDIALTWRRWVLDVDRCKGGNYSLGLGVKFPTGDPHAMHEFPNLQGQNLMSRSVDWSIQPGTGGWGIIFDFQGFKKLGDLSIYASGTYLAEPLNVNGTPSILANLVTVTPANEYRRYNTAADQYLIRLGCMLPIKQVKGLALSVGARMEGVPSKDLIGLDDGFRRPGHAVSIEPGLIYNSGRDTYSVFAPVAIERRRENDAKGNRGDATFADYILLFGYSHRFGK